MSFKAASASWSGATAAVVAGAVDVAADVGGGVVVELEAAGRRDQQTHR